MFIKAIFITLVASIGLICSTLGNSIDTAEKALDGRIVGGELTTIEKFPFQVSLQYVNKLRCGGSILTQYFILTAAHCTDGTVTRLLTIRSGSSYHKSGGTISKIAEVTEHPNYDATTSDNDISLIKLEVPLIFNAKTYFIRLATVAPAAGTPADVIGWGTTKEGGPTSKQLRVAQVPIVSDADCELAYGEDAITDSMICAGLPEGGKDTCQGDSGGPMVANGHLVGATSFGLGCARAGYPGVYANVAELSPYILSITGPQPTQAASEKENLLERLRKLWGSLRPLWKQGRL